jgi:hypothetical protein
MRSLPLITTDPAGWVAPPRVRARDRLSARLFAWRLDEALAAGACPDASVPLSLRAGRLIGLSTRRRLSREIDRVIRDARRPVSPHDREFARWQLTIAPSTSLLHRLRSWLAGWEPVEAGGVAWVRLLLRDGAGPLYDSPDPETLAASLRVALARLQPQL